MNTINGVLKNQIKTMVTEIVEETFERELMKVRSSLVKYVSKSEQIDIEKLYNKPSRKYVRSLR